MARFAGKVGFAVPTEIRPGVIKDVITEKEYFGDEVQPSRQTLTADKVNDDLIADVTVEIVADSYVSDNIFAIRYVEWAGTRWKASNVGQRGVRLLLRLGGVYNGPTPSVSDN